MSDHFGGSDFISYYMSEGIPSFDGINNALSHFGYSKTFESVFHDWKLANLLRSDFPGFGKYNYDSLNLNDPDIIPIRMYEVSGLKPAMTGSQFGNTISYYGDDTGISAVSAYGSDYIKFTNWNKTGRLTFDGNDYAIYGWRFTTYWYSGTGVDLADLSLTGTAYVDPSNPTLTFNTKYSIEEYWDFGFVQVSTDGGSTWTSLENDYTTHYSDPDAISTATDNLPGLTGESPDFPSWMAMSFDISAYSGQTIMIQFRYVTDWYTSYEGWYINDVQVSDSAVSLNGNEYPAADFEVTMLQATYLFGRWYYIPIDMPLNSANKATLLASAKSPNYIIMVVTPTMDIGTADYLFSAIWR